MHAATPAPVETPAVAEYEESKSEHSFEIPRIYPEAPEKEELDIPSFLCWWMTSSGPVPGSISPRWTRAPKRYAAMLVYM